MVFSGEVQPEASLEVSAFDKVGEDEDDIAN